MNPAMLMVTAKLDLIVTLVTLYSKGSSLDSQTVGYRETGVSPDSIAYACAICSTALFFNKMRYVPDDLCLKCYRDFSHCREEDWLKFLFKKERSRRIKLLRYRKRGIDYQPTSYEDYLSSVEEHNER